MKLLDKHNWLNFTLVLLGFPFFYSLSALIIGKFYVKAVTETTTLTASHHWIVSLVIGLILSLGLAVYFCKPRAPLFIGTAVFLGAYYSLSPMLYSALSRLDLNLRHSGLRAFETLLPHVLVILVTALAAYLAWLSNRPANKS